MSLEDIYCSLINFVEYLNYQVTLFFLIFCSPLYVVILPYKSPFVQEKFQHKPTEGVIIGRDQYESERFLLIRFPPYYRKFMPAQVGGEWTQRGMLKR